MSIIEDITKHIEQNHNILLYMQDIYKYYTDNKNTNKWAYISSPSKGKYAIQHVVETLSPNQNHSNKSVAQLIEELKRISRIDKIIIFINNFEHVNKRTLEYYREIIELENVLLVANISSDEEFIDQSFLKNFVLLNSEEFSTNRSNSINIKYTLLLLLSVFIFLLFIRLELSVVGYLVTALWFTFLMYRSFYYISR